MLVAAFVWLESGEIKVLAVPVKFFLQFFRLYNGGQFGDKEFQTEIPSSCKSLLQVPKVSSICKSFFKLQDPLQVHEAISST
jgi:hypothetical protein